MDTGANLYSRILVYIYTHNIIEGWLCLHTNTIPIFKRISYDFLIFAHPEIFLRFSSIVCVLLLFSTVQSVGTYYIIIYKESKMCVVVSKILNKKYQN